MTDLVLAMTGASGAIYGIRLLHLLLAAGRTVHLTISPAAAQVIRHELGLLVELEKFEPGQLLPADEAIAHDSKLNLLRAQGGSSIFSESDSRLGRIVYHHFQD